MALAIQPFCQEVFGIDPDPDALAEAQKSGIFVAVSNEPASWLPQVDLVVLAAPVKIIIELITRLPGWHPGKVMVLDLGSTKGTIVGAMESMPERFDPLGGHPMCGKETASFKTRMPVCLKIVRLSLPHYNVLPNICFSLLKSSSTGLGLIHSIYTQLHMTCGLPPLVMFLICLQTAWQRLHHLHLRQ